jgi:hypothetical protein
LKADLSRATFDRARRYRSVRMQQGRVQLDADWNEQQDILNNRIEIETRDSLGPVAVPIDNPGFGLSPVGSDLAISIGCFYVDGLLCENPSATTVAHQPDLPDTASPVLLGGTALLPLPPAGIKASDINGVVVFNNAGQAVAPADGRYLAYLETWQRHLSALEEPSLREVALGGPDTCTREKTVWQVKLLRAGNIGAALDCQSNIPVWTALTAAPDGRLAARAEASIPPKTPCQLPPEAGYRLLENHLYRVEIHDDGSVAGKARYKWSRDNGSLASRVVHWLDDPIDNEFEVASIGRDEVLAITPGCWVEFIDDTHELLGQPGPLVPVVRTEGNVVTVDLTKRIGHALEQALFPANPRVRRWDGVAEIKPAPIAPPTSGWEELAQDGIELKFAPGSYRIGDYWLIPARTATAAIEWPLENDKPAFRSPAGVLRAFARLALLEFAAGVWTLKSDCRPLFAPLAQSVELEYAGGDGQSIMPPTGPGADVLTGPLPSKLRAIVRVGHQPVAGARVAFSIDLPNPAAGSLAGAGAGGGISGTQIEVLSDASGVAEAAWTLSALRAHVVQRASATLITSANPGQLPPPPLHYTASLDFASGVAYEPGACTSLQGQTTVQEALDKLCLEIFKIKQSEFIIVTDVILPSGDRRLDNNEFVKPEELLEGFVIAFDFKPSIDPQDGFEPIARLTLEIPFPSSSRALIDWQRWWPGQHEAPAFGTSPLHLTGSLKIESNKLIWRPGKLARQFLETYHTHRFGLGWNNEPSVAFQEPYIKGWITLRGNSIWSGAGTERRYLNGDILRFPIGGNPFSIFGDDGSGLGHTEQLRSRADPQRAADFELWFKLDVRPG